MQPAARDSAWILMVAASALLPGCWRSAPPPAPAPVAKTTPVAAPSPVVPAPAEAPVEPQAVANDANASAPPVDAVEQQPAMNRQPDAKNTEVVDAEPSKERVLLFTARGPIIIDFQLSIDGQPHGAALDRLVEEVMQFVDSNGDGRPTWKELCASKRLKYGQFGNLPIEGDNGEKQIVERYDIDRDGVVDRTELPRFLTRNAGGSRSFSVRGSSDYRDLNRRGAPTWRLIDADDDGAISADEREAAASRLGSRDTNDDEILLAADLNPRLQVMNMGMMDENRRRGPDAIKLLGERADWSGVRLSLENQYGGSRSLHADCFPLSPELFGLLDKNADGRLVRDEFPELNHVPPDVVVAVEFGKAADERTEDREQGTEEETSEEKETSEGETPAEPSGPKMRLVHIAEHLAMSGESVIEQPGRLTLRVAGMTLTLYTNDTVAGGDFKANAKAALAMYDGNKDGYLEASEVPEGIQAQFGRFEAIDTDEDGKIYLGEILAYQSQQQAGLRAQIHAKASDREDALFAVLDADRDERLDSRELEAAGQTLAALDRDGDGLVTPDELPEAMVLGLARGSLENADGLFVPPPVFVRTPDAAAPKWFTSMDANGDGAISKREFLGTAEKFAEFDASGNGLLEVNEAMMPTDADESAASSASGGQNAAITD